MASYSGLYPLLFLPQMLSHKMPLKVSSPEEWI